jgi:hypothetical protein
VALGDTTDVETFGCLGQLLSDPDPRVRRVALASLSRLQGEDLVSRIVALTADTHVPVQAAALLSLTLRADSETLASLRSALSIGENPLVIRIDGRKCASRLPGRSLPDGFELPLDDPWVVEITIRSLEALADLKVARVIEGLILSRSPRVRGQAARSLWKFGELWAADTVNDLLCDGVADGWEAGIEALAELAVVCRLEGQLMHHPLLRTALRRHPSFESNARRPPR